MILLDGSSATGDIRNLVNKGRRAEAESNRQALRPIVDVVLTCARQNIALRGHGNDGLLDEQENRKMTETSTASFV